MHHSSTHTLLFSRQGFTLVEMMIVISIIMTLLGFVFLPYGYYMQRSYVEKSIDSIGQGWVLAHKDIRNGKISHGNTIANKVLIFRKGSSEVEQYLLSGTVIPPVESFPVNTDIQKENSLFLDAPIEILGFSGTNISNNDDMIGYYIEAPYASGAFFTGSRIPFSSTGIFLSIGYNGADISSGRAQKMLLKTYLQ